MKFVKFISILLIISLIGCVRAAPYLTEEQEKRIDNVNIFRVSSTQEKDFTIISEVDAADCSGPHRTRLYGNEDLAIDTLKRKAVALGADAIIDVSCEFVPFINNCWAARVCKGKAVLWK